MIKKLITFFILAFIYLAVSSPVSALEEIKIELTPIPCNSDANSCPQDNKGNDLKDIYPQLQPPQSCATSFTDFQSDPRTKHYWIEDPEVTAQGKADERARQFIYWVLNKNAIDNHSVLREVWQITRNLSYFFLILAVAVMGIGFIIGQRSNFQINIKLWPSLGKIAGALLWITFSAAVVIFMIQLSELVMRFFIENLGGKNLFTIYFVDVNGQPAGTSESGYSVFYGCRDLNVRVQEAARSEMFVLKATNITYYVMGIMLLLRKILLWFMLFISPFLAILFPFRFIRNVGWIWIGVFFQWLFYGPLFALFLGALAKIWEKGIPFLFDFSRVNNISGYVYPTAINLIYGGPAQQGVQHQISILNNGNNVDTFMEYVITLIMLWAVIFFPWWLLRIFRDYCCDGIYAMKNILLSMYDQTRGGPSPTPSPSPAPTFLKTSIQMPKEVEVPVRVKLETVEDIKKTRTEDIARTLNLSATKLTDVAKFETQKDTREIVQKNLSYLSNPIKAETPTERQMYMNLRTELFNRAIRDDKVAKQILSATSTSAVEKIQKREEILKTTPYAQPITHVVSVKVNMPQDKVTSVSSTLLNTINASNKILSTIAQNTQITLQQVQQILASYKRQIELPKPTTAPAKASAAIAPAQVIDAIAKETGVDKDTVIKVIQRMADVVKSDKELAKEVSDKENIKPEQLQQIVDAQVPAVAESEKNVEKTITIPPSISIEDYEEVKSMWTQQYEQGEVPVTENIGTRQAWVDNDIISITNTLNKLLSPSEELRQQGLDEIGYILPIFLINNLKGEELLVYLKAKLEAAKEVKNRLFKEKEITEKVKAENEKEFVDVDEPKKAEAAKTMTMEEELKIPEEKTPPNATPLKTDKK